MGSLSRIIHQEGHNNDLFHGNNFDFRNEENHENTSGFGSQIIPFISTNEGVVTTHFQHSKENAF